VLCFSGWRGGIEARLFLMALAFCNQFQHREGHLWQTWRPDPFNSAPEVRPDTAEVFFELLRNLPWEDHFHIILASRTWSERLQDEFEVAMKRLERRAWRRHLSIEVPGDAGERSAIFTRSSKVAGVTTSSPTLICTTY